MLTSFAVAEKFAGERAIVDLERHRLRQVAFRDGTDHTRHFRVRLDQIGHQRVDRFDAGQPVAARGRQRGALTHVTRLANDGADACELFRHPLIEIDRVVQRVVDLTGHPDLVDRHPDRKIAALVRG